MLAGAHLIFGNAIVLKLTQEPLAAFFIGLISHHIGDFLPHIDSNIFESETKQEFKNIREWPLKLWALFLTEFAIGIIIFLYFGRFVIEKYPLLVLSASFGSLLPDIARAIIPKNILYKFKLSKLYFDFHQNFHFLRNMKNSPIHKKLLISFIEGVIIIFSIMSLL